MILKIKTICEIREIEIGELIDVQCFHLRTTGGVRIYTFLGQMH